MNIRLCHYCTKPAEAATARLSEDRNSPLVALDHGDCYALFMIDLMLMSGGVPGALPAAGCCHRCEQWVPRARVVAEIDSDSATGNVVVRCLACCEPEPAGPLTEQLHAYVIEDVLT